MEPLYETQTELTFELYTKARKNLLKKKFKVYIFGAAVFCALFIFKCIMRGALLQIVYYGFAAGILLAFADSFLDKRFKTAYYNNPDAGFIIFCMFYEDYVIFSRKNDENKIYYKELCKITESRDEYCFFAENDKFYILEKRGCDSRLRKYINKIKKGCKR